ncbi:MAG: hypothetical protein LBR45_00380, partial [Bacteroidales bacterium]|nr:hypothetical protein [Bacteroidales bacterium]
MRKILPYCLFLFVLCTTNVRVFGQSGQFGQAIPKPNIGDSIVNPDGSIGVVFWINPEETMGYMVNIIQHEPAQWGLANAVPGLPQISNPIEFFLDTNGYSNTVALRNAFSIYSFAANLVDFENGWFLPSAGIMNYLYMAYPFIRTSIVKYGGDIIPDTVMGNEFQMWTSTRYNFIGAVVMYNDGRLIPGQITAYRRFRSVKRFSILPETPLYYDTT